MTPTTGPAMTRESATRIRDVPSPARWDSRPPRPTHPDAASHRLGERDDQHRPLQQQVAEGTAVFDTQRIPGSDAAESGRARLLETVLGVVIAFVVLGLAEALGPDKRWPA